MHKTGSLNIRLINIRLSIIQHNQKKPEIFNKKREYNFYEATSSCKLSTKHSEHLHGTRLLSRQLPECPKFQPDKLISYTE